MLTGLALLLWLPGSTWAGTFTDATSSANAQASGSTEAGAIFADLNNDGWLDIVGNTSASSEGGFYFVSDRDGTFTVADWDIEGFSEVFSRSVVTADFNRDGCTDLVRTGSQKLAVYLSNCDSELRPTFGASGAPTYLWDANSDYATGNPGTNVEGVVVFDVDNDGWTDLVVNEQDGVIMLENQGNDGSGNHQGFVLWDETTVGVTWSSEGSRADYMAAADVDGDGYVDFVNRMEGGPDLYWNDGDGSFTAETTLNWDVSNGNKGGVIFCDLDDDGDLDILITDESQIASEGHNTLWVNNGSRSFTASAAFSAVAASSSNIDDMACADVDNDGDLDVFMSAGGTDYLFRNDGSLSFTQDNNGISDSSNGESVVAADFDQDGDVDFYVNDTNSNQLWTNDENAGGSDDYLVVRPVASQGTCPTAGAYAPAIGATVQLYNSANTVALSGLRHVDGGKGHGAMGPPEVFFGLENTGTDTATYTVRVTYPHPLNTTVSRQVTPSTIGGWQMMRVAPNDADGDSILDSDEVAGDADSDGLDNDEDWDSDGDGIRDEQEAGDADPCTAAIDSDNDGLPDYLDTDSDNDGVTDAVEWAAGSSNRSSDTDGDGLSDADEINGTGSLAPYGPTNPASADTDNDGVTDDQEIANGTDPTVSDSNVLCGDTLVASITLTGHVVCPPGYTGDAVTIAADNVTLDGDGFRVMMDSDGDAVYISGQSDVTIQDLDVSTTPGRLGDGIRARDVTRLTIEDVTASGRDNGVNIDGSSNPSLTIRRVDVSNATDNGIRIGNVDSNLVLDGITFDGSDDGLEIDGLVGPWTLSPGTHSWVSLGTDTSDYAIKLEDVANVTVDGLNLSSAGAVRGIDLRGVNDVTIENCTLSGLHDGIYSSTSGGISEGVVIRNNTVTNATGTALYLDGMAADLVLTGNALDGSVDGLVLRDFFGPYTVSATNTFTGITDDAIKLYDTVGITIDGLNLSGSGGDGIYLEAALDTTIVNTTIDGRGSAVASSSSSSGRIRTLTIQDNTFTNSTGRALDLHNLRAPVTISGNDFTGSVDGIHIEDSVGPITITASNVLTGAGGDEQDAIEIDSSSNITIDGLDLSRGSAHADSKGIKVDNSSSDIVVRNTDLSGRKYGMLADDCSNLTIEGNDFTSENIGLELDDCFSGLTLRNNTYGGGGRGLLLDNVDSAVSLTLEGSDFTDCARPVWLEDSSGPVSLDVTRADFDSVLPGSNDFIVTVRKSQDVTLTGPLVFQDLGGSGKLVHVDDSDRTTVQTAFTCGPNEGIDVQSNSTDTTLTNIYVSNANKGFEFDSSSSPITYTAFFGGNSTDIDDNASNDSGTLTVLNDDDGDGTPDLCDPCPNDALIGIGDSGSCVDADLCVGDDNTGDADADGWCADLDCDDNDPNTWPGAPELCDGIDNNCILGIDEATVFTDADGDTCDDCTSGGLDVANDGTDTDGDGLCDAGDPDDDDDGVADGSDASPLLNTVCQDSDDDLCDDCAVVNPPDPANDGTDTDGDGTCDASDGSTNGALLTGSDVSWSIGGVGAPSVIYDRQHGTWLMAFETQSGDASADCPVGEWAIGLATSTDGTTWTDSGAPIVSPTAMTYYRCVTAHPSIVEHDGIITVFFKAEREAGVFAGVGRVLLTWNGSGYTASVPDASPVLALAQDFGFPRVVYDGVAGVYRMALTQRPSMHFASGSGTSFTMNPSPGAQPGFQPWARDEIFSPALMCRDNGKYDLLMGGRQRSSGSITKQVVNVVSTTDLVTFKPERPLFDTDLGDAEKRHWDALPLKNGGILMYYSTLDGPGGQSQIQMGSTAAWTVDDVLDKHCTPQGCGLITDGLVLHLDSERGITASGSSVTGWDDLSGRSNDFTSIHGTDPQLVTDGVNGRDYLQFGGSAGLSTGGSTAGLPTGDADRTVFFVARYRDTQSRNVGFAWGTPSTNQAFGLIVDSGGDLTVLDEDSDFDSRYRGLLQGWLVQSAVYTAGSGTHHLNGVTIDEFTTTFATGSTRAVVGVELDESGNSMLDVAAVLVYDRALSTEEHEQVENYLESRYLGLACP